MISGAHSLSRGRTEPWALEWGQDRFGAFQSFAVGKVVQRMRWVPPGTFVMGSPVAEAGRFRNEKLHEVTLTRGYWLADTPCTQAFWHAVMGNNPSRFQSPERPVEQVSWDDCQEFVAKLDGRVPGFGARLPSEAEWEYACRAGTTAATWAGALDLRGHNDAPVLDAIAWYGGNSGNDFDLNNGYDSSDWQQKQYPHTRAGPRPVRGKRPNPLGLFDMLGNVYEWCEDWYEPYASWPATDPTGHEAGSRRVLRGGSWGESARHVRAAVRGADAPGHRLVFLGFRLARGQEPGRGAARPGGPRISGKGMLHDRPPRLRASIRADRGDNAAAPARRGGPGSHGWFRSRDRHAGPTTPMKPPPVWYQSHEDNGCVVAGGGVRRGLGLDGARRRGAALSARCALPGRGVCGGASGRAWRR